MMLLMGFFGVIVPLVYDCCFRSKLLCTFYSNGQEMA